MPQSEEKEKVENKQNGRISKEDATHWFFQGLNANSTSEFEEFWSKWSDTGGDEYGPSVLSDSKEKVENISGIEMKILELLEDIYPNGAFPEKIAEDTETDLIKTKTAITWLEDMGKIKTIKTWTGPHPHMGEKFVLWNPWVEDKTERVNVYRYTHYWGNGIVFLPANMKNKKEKSDWEYLGTYDIPKELLDKIEYGFYHRE